MLNPEVLKCHEDLITLDTYVQQGKTMDNKFFICENINIFKQVSKNLFQKYNTYNDTYIIKIMQFNILTI